MPCVVVHIIGSSILCQTVLFQQKYCLCPKHVRYLHGTNTVFITACAIDQFIFHLVSTNTKAGSVLGSIYSSLTRTASNASQ